MSLKDDINEAKELWVDSSLTFKIVIVISTFLATSSIANMADVVFEWEGFILD